MAPPTDRNISHLAIGDIFAKLTAREQLYAHHLSRASWHGTRIVLQQVSPEAEDIFDFIMEVHRSLDGSWGSLAAKCGIAASDVHAFIEYAAQFLCSLGNYLSDSGQKFVLLINSDVLSKMSAVSDRAGTLLQRISGPVLAKPPYHLGFPSEKAHSNYYLSGTSGLPYITREEIELVSKVMEENAIEPENTRIKKTVGDGDKQLVILQASSETGAERVLQQTPEVRVAGGDHAEALSRVCKELEEARQYTSNDAQKLTISSYLVSFRTGNMNAYRESQKTWVTDRSPTVENTIGFVEMYRDPAGLRAEWQGVVCLADKDETKRLGQFVERSADFIRLLPWAVPGVNNGQGPFEKDRFETPDFSIVHGLTFCTSNMWHATNIPNYNDIRENYGYKNIVISNRLSVLNDPSNPCHFVQTSQKDFFRSCIFVVEFITTAVHELLGHGTGKLLSETSPGKYNFDTNRLPIDSLSGRPIEAWYKPGQTWTSVFGEIATAVEECRATLVSYYLIDDHSLLEVFGYSDGSTPAAGDLIYATYMKAAVAGLQALEAFNEEGRIWGEPHARGNFAILAWLLKDGEGTIGVRHTEEGVLEVCVDRSKVLTHGKPSLGRLLHKLHVWRCSPDPTSCRELFEPLTAVEGQFEAWRMIVCSMQETKWRFVQANTFCTDGEVTLKEYDATNEGIIQSWVERDV